MIVLKFFEAFGSIYGFFIDLLPDAATSLVLPGFSSVMDVLTDLNAIVPIVGPIKAALGMFTAFGLFIVWKVVEYGWKLLPLT